MKPPASHLPRKSLKKKDSRLCCLKREGGEGGGRYVVLVIDTEANEDC